MCGEQVKIQSGLEGPQRMGQTILFTIKENEAHRGECSRAPHGGRELWPGPVSSPALTPMVMQHLMGSFLGEEPGAPQDSLRG